METLESAILGIIQGLTEFFPVSSSGHLALLQNYFKEVNVGFDVILHLATLLAIIVFFYKDIWSMIRAFFRWDTKSDEFKLIWYIIIGSIPAGIIGWFFRDFIYNSFSNLYIIALGFFISGMFIFTASFSKRDKIKLGLGNSFVIGISQALALIPGLSRSGSTVSTGMLLGIKREKAIRFSFLLSIPAVIGSNILNFTDLKIIETFPFIIGFIFAFFSGIFAIFVFIKLVDSSKFRWFAYYCWILAIISLVISFI